MSDPLSVVRHATIGGEPITYADGHYSIGGHRFPEATKTAFKRGLRSSDEYYYTLRDVIFFLENAQLPVGEYRRKVVENKLAPIVEQDRGPLQKYMTGAIDTCPQIDVAVQSSFKATTVRFAAAVAAGATEPAAPSASTGEKISSTTNTTATSTSTSANATGADDAEARGERKAERKRKADKLEVSVKAPQSQHNFMSQVLANMPVLTKEVIDEDKATMARLRADEYAPQNRNSVMNVQGADFSMALKIFNDKVLKPLHQGHNGAGSAQGNTAHHGHAAAHVAAPAIPAALAAQGPTRSLIIIVPNSLTAMLNIFNAQAFLERGEFRSNQNADHNISNRPKSLSFARSINSRAVPYKIVDDAKLLTKEDWKRVVAVFVTGQQWQLRGYLWSEPGNLFQNVLGFHVIMEGNAVDPVVSTWNCNILKVNQFKEHANATASKEFWHKVDEFVRFRKPGLMG